MKTLRPVFIVVLLVLMVGMACSIGTPAKPTQAPVPTEPPVKPTVEEPPTVELPTEEPAPTEIPPTEAPPVNEKFFTEEFDQDPGSNWEFTVLGPNSAENAAKATYSFDSGLMIFNIDFKQLYAYYMYEAQSYDNVRVDMRFENRGANSQNISLVCRASDEGWYEFSVGSDGLWYLYAHTPKDGFITIKNGGSKAVKQGKAVNEYGLACNKEKIGLFINGQEVRDSPFVEKKFALRRGTVGFNVSSINVIPVKVEVDWFQISEP
jgi:hypothetical protein